MKLKTIVEKFAADKKLDLENYTVHVSMERFTDNEVSELRRLLKKNDWQSSPINKRSFLIEDENNRYKIFFILKHITIF